MLQAPYVFPLRNRTKFTQSDLVGEDSLEEDTEVTVTQSSETSDK